MGRIVLVKGGFPLALGYELTQGGEEPCVCQGGTVTSCVRLWVQALGGGYS